MLVLSTTALPQVFLLPGLDAPIDYLLFAVGFVKCDASLHEGCWREGRLTACAKSAAETMRSPLKQGILSFLCCLR